MSIITSLVSVQTPERLDFPDRTHEERCLGTSFTPSIFLGCRVRLRVNNGIMLAVTKCIHRDPAMIMPVSTFRQVCSSINSVIGNSFSRSSHDPLEMTKKIWSDKYLFFFYRDFTPSHWTGFQKSEINDMTAIEASPHFNF